MGRDVSATPVISIRDELSLSANHLPFLSLLQSKMEFELQKGPQFFWGGSKLQEQKESLLTHTRATKHQ